MHATRDFPLRSRGLATLASLAALLVFAAVPALADSAVLSPDGTLYEVFPARYADVVPSAEGSVDAAVPVLALRMTASDAAPVLEIVEGSFDPSQETSVSVEFDAWSGTLFVAYTKVHGLMADMNVALRRDGRWFGQDILSNRGLFLSINPKVVVTRQTYLDFDGTGGTKTKTRSIFSLVWWEESGLSQARYAAIFAEDDAFRLADIVAYNLNELSGTSGQTDASGLKLSAFVFPSVQRDPASNGGVLVTFANLVTRQQQVVRISFPDDITKLSPPGSLRAPDEAYARAHVPIGRTVGGGRLPMSAENIAEVGAFASDSGVTTFYWFQRDSLLFTRSDAPEGAAPKQIPLTAKIGRDRAVSLVRDFATRN